MTTINAIRSSIQLAGREFPMTYAYGENPDIEGGWINGEIEIDGNRFAAGGGWVQPSGYVQPYGYGDSGDVDEVADCLGLDPEAVVDALQDACPRERLSDDA